MQRSPVNSEEHSCLYHALEVGVEVEVEKDSRKVRRMRLEEVVEDCAGAIDDEEEQGKFE